MNTLNLKEELEHIEKIFEEYPELKKSENRFELLRSSFQDESFLSLLTSELSQVNEFRILAWPYKEKIYSSLMDLNIDPEIKDILINFKDDFTIFIPAGSGGHPGKKPKKLTEDEKKKYKSVIDLILTVSIIFGYTAPIAVDLHGNFIKNKEIEYTYEIEDKKLDLKERELDLKEEESRQEYDLERYRNAIEGKSLEIDERKLELRHTAIKRNTRENQRRVVKSKQILESIMVHSYKRLNHFLFNFKIVFNIHIEIVNRFW